MPWTAPKTWTVGETLTAGDLNIHVRDNLREMAAARAKTNGGYFVASGENELVERSVHAASESKIGETTSTTYGDLTDAEEDVGETIVGPFVMAETSGRAAVFFGCEYGNTSINQGFMSVELSGSTVSSASDEFALLVRTGAERTAAMHTFFDGLTEGVTTFTCKYRVGGGTGTFTKTHIIVMPF